MRTWGKEVPNLQDNFGKKDVLTSRIPSEKGTSKTVETLRKKIFPNQ